MTRVHSIAFWLISVAGLCMAATSCSNDGCDGNSSSLPLASLYVGNQQQTVSGLTIMGIGAPGDLLLVDSATASEVYLPLRANAASTSYAISRWVTTEGGSRRLYDTLTIDYEPIEFFHSLDCGTMFNFNVKSTAVTTHGIDSVIPLTPMITNSTTPALRIYFTDFSQ